MRAGEMALLIAGLIAALEMPMSAHAAIYDPRPLPSFYPTGAASTGAAFVDLDRDGCPDLVVSNGNDLTPQRVVVHMNKKLTQRGDGRCLGISATYPDWYSDDYDHHGGLSVGDINGDGWPDVAVAVLVGSRREIEKGGVKIYFNRNGVLESVPSYRSADNYIALGCTLADVNADGRLDLIVPAACQGTGRLPLHLAKCQSSPGNGRDEGPRTLAPSPVRIYLNEGGALGRAPAWTSAAGFVAGDAVAADINQDGWMDLAVAAEQALIFFGGPKGVDRVPLERVPSWRSEERADVKFGYGAAIDVGRLHPNDSTLSVAVAFGCLHKGCKSAFHVYNPRQAVAIWPGQGAPQLQFGSRLRFVDVNADAHLDLLLDQWGSMSIGGGPLWIYQGQSAGYAQSPDENFPLSLAGQAIDSVDLKQRGVCLEEQNFTLTRPSSVLTLGWPHVESIVEVKVNGQTLTPAQYAWMPRRNEISLAALAPSAKVDVKYLASPVRDLFVASGNALVGSVFFMSFLSIPTEQQSDFQTLNKCSNRRAIP